MRLGCRCEPFRWGSCLCVLLASGIVALIVVPATRHTEDTPFRWSFPICRISAAQLPDEAPFLDANEVTMSKMMDGMAPRPTGDVDADFAAMMIPHHQGAIEMAEAELRFGHNETLRRIAQEIIVDQQGEIGAMRLALGQALPPSAPAPTGGEASGARRPATTVPATP
jgi:hypothetical protein